MTYLEEIREKLLKKYNGTLDEDARVDMMVEEEEPKPPITTVDGWLAAGEKIDLNTTLLDHIKKEAIANNDRYMVNWVNKLCCPELIIHEIGSIYDFMLAENPTRQQWQAYASAMEMIYRHPLLAEWYHSLISNRPQTYIMKRDTGEIAPINYIYEKNWDTGGYEISKKFFIRNKHIERTDLDSPESVEWRTRSPIFKNLHEWYNDEAELDSRIEEKLPDLLNIDL